MPTHLHTVQMSSEVFKFTGTRSSHYDNYLGPFLFEPYGKEMAARVPLTNANAVLEIASGTGRATRHLRQRLPASARLVASDLSPDMLEVAKSKFKSSDAIEFMMADMQNLPFESNTFDVVVCQFGIMFPPDKQKAFDEVHRVLKSGGVFLFSTWEQTERVEIFKLIFNDHVLPFFTGENPARFLVPFSLYDPEVLKAFLLKSNFTKIDVDRVVLKGVGESASDLVKGFFVTHAIGQEVADRDRQAFESISQEMEEAIIRKFSNNPVVCNLAAYFFSGVK
jgi:ubiquinone/menaquinone biosynthesis C-methylase UbiE